MVDTVSVQVEGLTVQQTPAETGADPQHAS